VTAKRRLTDFVPDERNANRHTQRGMSQLETSLRTYGAGRSILVDRNNKVIAGNATLETAVDIGLDGAIVVPTDGKQLVVVQRTDLDIDSKEARALALADNRISQTNLDFDAAELAALAAEGVDLSSLWDDDELAALIGASDEPPGDGDDTPLDLHAGDVPDAIWPSDNEYGIPLLDMQWQANAFDAPIIAWGEKARIAKHKGSTVHFYVDDYRFDALWRDPAALQRFGAITAVEPNTSIYTDMPMAVALYQMYRKRWMARWWQTLGIRIVVDLNISERYADLALLGVPKGWAWYATRGYAKRLDGADREYERAVAHAAPNTVQFMVVGGGRVAKTHCMERGWLWVPDRMRLVDGETIQ
jgi:hypothetical protein